MVSPVLVNSGNCVIDHFYFLNNIYQTFEDFRIFILLQFITCNKNRGNNNTIPQNFSTQTTSLTRLKAKISERCERESTHTYTHTHTRKQPNQYDLSFFRLCFSLFGMRRKGGKDIILHTHTHTHNATQQIVSRRSCF